jgi:hypothetical protein
LAGYLISNIAKFRVETGQPELDKAELDKWNRIGRYDRKNRSTRTGGQEQASRNRTARIGWPG